MEASKRYKTFISIISILVMLLGFAVMMGWLLQIALLKSVFPGFATMKFNTALCFVLSGISLYLTIPSERIHKSAHVLSKICAFILFTVGVSTLSQEFFNYYLGIDQLFVADIQFGTNPQPFPGRMSVLTAICNSMMGMALIAIKTERNNYRLLAQGLLNVVTVLSAIALIGYLFKVPTFYKLNFITSMAVHTAVAFFLLSVAASLISPTLGITGLFTKSEIGNVMARKIFLQLSITVLILGYLRMLAHRYAVINVEFGIALFTLSFILTSLFLVWSVSGKLNAITRQKAETESSLLRTSQLASIIDSSTDAILSERLDGTILTWNQGAEKILGYTLEEVKNRHFSILFPGELDEKETITMEKVINNEIVGHYEAIRVRKDKKPIHVSITLSPIKNEKGEIIAVSKVLRDISKTKQAEAKLKELSDRLYLATSTSAIGIWEYDVINNKLVWDTTMFQLYGIKQENFSGVYKAWRAGLHPDDAATCDKEIQLALSGEKEFDIEFRVIWPDRSIHFIKARALVQRDVKGKPLKMLGTNWDITHEKLAKQEIEQSNQRSKIFVAQAPTAIAMFDTDMRYVAASEKWVLDYDLHGIELVGRSHYEVFPEIGEDWKKIHRECLAGAIHKRDEDKFLRTNGTVQWLKWEDKPWYNELNKIGGIIMYTEDITTKKHVEEQLRISEQAFRGNFENAAIGMAILNVKGQWLKVNRKVCNIVGYTEEELLKTTFLDITHPDDLDTDLTLLQELIAGTRDHYQMEKRYFHKDGHIVSVILAASMVKDMAGETLYFISQIIDISSLKKAEQQLAEALEKNQAILDASTQVAIISTDTKGTITAFNKGAENLLGYTAEEVINKKTPELIHVKEEVLKRGEELSALFDREIKGFESFIALAQERQADTREWSYVRKNNTRFPVQLTITAVKVASKITGYLGIATDISTIKKVEKEIQALLDVTQDQNSRLKNFAHIVSHNLRSHSGNIDSLIDLLMLEKPELKEMEIVKYIKEASNNLKETIAHLNDVALINYSIKENLQELNLYDYVEKAMSNVRALANSSKVELMNEVNPQDKVLGLPAYLESILLNFLTNGIKYSSDERISFVKVSTYLKEKYRVVMFEDNGMGIDLKLYGAKLFGMYKTFHKNSDSRGIGLFITKNQIEALGGKIEVESSVNKGTVFKIHLKYEKD